MSRKLVEKIIKPTENCVRCILHPMHIKSNGKLQDASLVPARGKNDVSLLREEYTTEADLVAHGQRLAKKMGESNKDQNFCGLLYVTPNIVDSVNQWASSTVSSLSGVEPGQSISEIKYAPMINDESYVIGDIPVYTEDPNIQLPHHADLHYMQTTCNTLMRQYGHEMMKRVKYKILEADGSWRAEVHAKEFSNFSVVPRLSIIVTFYKDAKFIEKCAESIASEIKGKAVEVIWISDDSNDGSAKIVEKFINLYGSQMSMYGISHQGQGYARNCGIEIARGEYVWFVDADDEIKEGSVNTILNAIDNGYDAYVFRTEEIKGITNKIVSQRRYLKTSNGPIKGITLLLEHCSFSPSLMMVFNRKRLIDSRICFSKDKYIDLYFMPRFLLFSKQIEVIPKIIYRYYDHPQKKGSPRFNDSIMKELLQMFDDYTNQANNTQDKEEKAALYYVGHILLIYILVEPKTKLFLNKVKDWGIDERLQSIKKVIRNSGYRGNGIKEWAFWSLASFSPLYAKKLFG